MKRKTTLLVIVALLFALGGGAIVWRFVVEPDGTDHASNPSSVSSNGSDSSSYSSDEMDEAAHHSTSAHSPSTSAPSDDSKTAASGHAHDDEPAESRAAPGGPFVVEGVVTTVDGVPLAGVDMTLFPFERTLFAHQAVKMLAELSQSPEPLASVVTNNRGEFRLEVDDAGRYLVKARAAGYDQAVEGPLDLHPREPQVFLMIPLPLGFRIEGRVIDDAFEPVAGVPLRLMKKGRGGDLSGFSDRVVSSDDGSFVFDGLEATDYVLMVPPLVRDGVSGAGRLFPSVTAPTSELEVQVGGGRTFRGRVTDRRRNPLAGAAVTALNPVSFDQVTADEDGVFELSLSGPDADLLIEHPGYLLLEQRITLGTARTVSRFVLNRGEVWSGQLVYPDGEPARGITVGALQASDFLGRLQTATTDDEGRFEFSGLAAGSGYLLPKLPGFWLPFDQAQFQQQDPGSVYTLAPTGTLRGIVLASSDIPLGEAWVGLAPVEATDLLGRAVQWLRGSREAWTDRAGNFSLGDILPGAPYRLEVSHPDASEFLRRLDALPSEPMEIVLSESAELELQLVDENDQPVQPATVLVQWPGGRPVTRRADGVYTGGTRYVSDSSGTVVIEGAVPGEATFFVLAESFVVEMFQRTSQPGERKVQKVTLRSAASLEVAVASSEGDPLGMVQIRISSSDGGDYSSQRRTGGDGLCVFSALPPGSYSVRAVQGQVVRQEETIEVEAGYQRIDLDW